MSGPTTCILIGDPITALLSAAGIRAAEAIHEGYANAAALRADHDAAREANRALQGAAAERGREALAREAGLAEARFEDLIALGEQLGAAAAVRATRPVRPEGTDVITLAAYVRALHGLGDELQAILVAAAARMKAQAEDEGEPTAIAVPAAAVVGGGTVAQRILERIAHLGPPPDDIASLAKELEMTLPGPRAELLAMELRRRVQAHAAAAQTRLVQEATAVIVRQSLKDLGYQVEEVADTLFVEGGVMHFRRPGWGAHMVRMRVDARAGSVNFNVVRAAEEGANEASVLDHLAEDRWCAEFPALLDALAARGIRLDVTRRLEAGEVPVQRVPSGQLPRFADEDEAEPASAAPLRARRP